jgi:hypothetical protein
MKHEYTVSISIEPDGFRRDVCVRQSGTTRFITAKVDECEVGRDQLPRIVNELISRIEAQQQAELDAAKFIAERERESAY